MRPTKIRFENEWPIARTQYTKLHLIGQPQSLSLENPENPMEVVYSAKNGKVLFDFRFTEDTELSGYMEAKDVGGSPSRKRGRSISR